MRTSKQRRFRHAGLALLVAGALASLGATINPQATGASNDNPPGNNGTVKVNDDPEWDKPNAPNDNDPHVDCQFEVVFYNFDEGDEGDKDFNATVTFEFQAPTTRPGHDTDQTILDGEVFIGEDAAGVGQDEDAREMYDLKSKLGGVEPQEEQGYHVKLTVNAPGSQGNDTKHKVFWVQCDAEPPPSTTTTTAPPSTTTTVPSATTTTVPVPTTTTTVAAPTTTTTLGPSVGGVTEERPTTNTVMVEGAVEQVTELPRTGARSGFLYTGMGLMLSGLAFLGLGRRR